MSTMETKVIHSVAKKFVQTLVISGAMLVVVPIWAQPATTRPARPGRANRATQPASADQDAAGKKAASTQQGADKWIAEGIGKKEWKQKKRERQRDHML